MAGNTGKVDGITVNNVDEEHDRNGENNESGELQKNEVVGKDDCELLEGLSINSPNNVDSRAKIPNHLPSAEESALLKGYIEEAIAKRPVHTPDCGHPNLGRDIEDCGSNLCWAIAAMECVCVTLHLKGADYNLIMINCDKLLKCHEEETPGYPSIIKKAFKYIKEHNVSKDSFYPQIAKRGMTKKVVPQEVKALRICGFQMLDIADELILDNKSVVHYELIVMRAIRKGPLVAGVRQSPEFAMLGNKIYEGSANEIMIDGKYCNHGVLVEGSGYDEKEDMRYWSIKNSAGTRWGDEGYGRVARPSSLPNGDMLLTSIMYPIFE